MNVLLKNNKLPLMTISVFGTFLSGCANDLIIEYGKGDEIHLVGYADNFDCSDPAYGNVKKVQTWTMQFADGSTKHLCALEKSISKKNSLQPIAPPAPQVIGASTSDRVGSDEMKAPSNSSSGSSKATLLPPD